MIPRSSFHSWVGGFLQPENKPTAPVFASVLICFSFWFLLCKCFFLEPFSLVCILHNHSLTCKYEGDSVGVSCQLFSDCFVWLREVSVFYVFLFILIFTKGLFRCVRGKVALFFCSLFWPGLTLKKSFQILLTMCVRVCVNNKLLKFMVNLLVWSHFCAP